MLMVPDKITLVMFNLRIKYTRAEIPRDHSLEFSNYNVLHFLKSYVAFFSYVLTACRRTRLGVSSQERVNIFLKLNFGTRGYKT